MKFNLFLLLLTTLTSVVLSQHHIIPGQSIIQLLGRDLYWDVNDGVVLYPGGVNPARWIIQPLPKGNFIKYINGGFVQYNGDSKQLNITDSGSPWLFEPSAEEPCFICSRENQTECATAVETNNNGWVVKAEQKHSSPYQLWRVYRVA
ncbi:hypothetical protein RhiirA1_443954 [Rhizophagus irregularis]|uniref:Ricin B lectin domain-containing protein n=1 Tax=Rhizophagus irregularis TaxID=588596 RepID=A0A2I1EYZ6_9GLOM|nr:hypothetical protein RhiirA1_443954 [Rhizophagus irregularis]PKY27339.1 hypothetical protein RhiirB3_529149 [Rhizophagus irregularis]CAB4493374.1 unnamed protein product [Rhizophagus irregularis]CAB5364874.1 unnamed protein product [Rhizophagus irregularis]